MSTQTSPKPSIVLIGGTLRTGSSTEKALRLIQSRCVARGAQAEVISGDALDLPPYAPERSDRSAAAMHLVGAVRRADAIVLGSPGYHGGVSGLVKNAIDYTEDLRGDLRSYFDGRPVGCIATGAGWQGAVAALAALRAIVHALRGWPTPLGVAINTASPAFTTEGDCISPEVDAALAAMTDQLFAFMDARRALRDAA